jgi:REP element-mobilizing transposase RayT
MGRDARRLIHEDSGGYHIISRVTGQNFLLGPREKDRFVEFLYAFCKIYFVGLHAYCVMDNHFHLLVTMRETEAQDCKESELLERVNLLRSFHRQQPVPALTKEVVSHFRDRLGSVSRFAQDLKQEFTRWYNRSHDRKGYFWSDRFRGVLIGHGKAQLACAAYIEMNPVRAKVVDTPEQYKWSSSGALMMNKEHAEEILHPVLEMPDGVEGFSDYRDFIRSVMEGECSEFRARFGLDSFSANEKDPSFSQGCIVGTPDLVNQFREQFGRPQKDVPFLFNEPDLGVTRVLRRGYD